MIWPNEQQDLLLKAAFCAIESTRAHLKVWNNKYSFSDLDNATRAILPILLQRVDIFKDLYRDSDEIERYYRYYRNLWFMNVQQVEILKKIMLVLINNEIKICLIDNGAMLLYHYPNIAMRPANFMMELLVNSFDLKKIIALLATLDFVPANKINRQLEQNIIQDQSKFSDDVAIAYRKDDIVLFIYWDLMSLNNRAVSFRTVTAVLSSTPVEILSSELQLVSFLLNDLSKKNNLSYFWWLIDSLYLLDRDQDKIDWPYFYYLIDKFGLKVQAKKLLAYAAQINFNLVSENFLISLK